MGNIFNGLLYRRRSFDPTPWKNGVMKFNTEIRCDQLAPKVRVGRHGHHIVQKCGDHSAMNKAETIGVTRVGQKTEPNWITLRTKLYPKWTILIGKRAPALLELKPLWYLGRALFGHALVLVIIQT